jgi:hypothetical protein
MVVRNLDFGRSLPCPKEADPILVIDPDRMLACSVLLQRFESVSGRGAQIAQHTCGVEVLQLASGDPNEIGGEPLWAFAVKNRSGGRVLKA